MIATFLTLAASLTLAFAAGVQFSCVRRREYRDKRRGGYLDHTTLSRENA